MRECSKHERHQRDCYECRILTAQHDLGRPLSGGELAALRSDTGVRGLALTMLEFRQDETGEDDFDVAEKVAHRLGFTETVYTSSSSLWGLFCLPDRAGQKHGCVVKTKELGFLFVSTLEDLQLHDLWDAYVKRETGTSPRELTRKRMAEREGKKPKAKTLSQSKEKA